MNIVFRTDMGRIAARIQRRAKVVTPSLIQAQRELGKLGVKKLKYYSSATAYTISHKPPYPYSVKEPAPPLPPWFINVQSGQLLEGWRYRVDIRPNAINITFYNMEDYIRYFGGTSLMIARPIYKKVLEDLQPGKTLVYRASYWNKWAKAQGA